MTTDHSSIPLGAHPLYGRNVLVTGGTGSFGQAFVREALQQGARRVVVFSRDELKQALMAQALSDPRLRWFIGDVRDRPRLDQAMRDVQVVVHAAAMKRIETCEANPDEAVSVNVGGTRNVALAAIAAGVEKAVFLSTDKAPAPATLYGATKLCAERLWVQSNVYAAGTHTRLSCTRYGNVLASRGSVVGLWREQVAAGVPVTITDERMSRYWMQLAEAVQLVVLALEQMRGGELFVPKVPSSSVLDLARAVVEQNGQPYAPGHVVTGLRPGERMHETLISPEESRTTFDAGTHYVIEPEARTWEVLPPLPWPLVADGFTYRSDTNAQQATVDELRRLIA